MQEAFTSFGVVDESKQNEIFLKTLVFLDAKSIANCALVSRKTRLWIGQHLKNCHSMQREFYSKAQEKRANHQVYFKAYEDILKMDLKFFQDKAAYERFVRQVNEKNKDYFEKFYSIVLSRKIQLSNDRIELSEQKRGLLLLWGNIQAMIVKIQEPNTKCILPALGAQLKLESTMDQTQYHSNKIINKFFKFLNKFLQMYRIYENYSNVSEEFAVNQQNKSYINSFGMSFKVLSCKSIDVYQKKLYYLRTRSKYFEIVSFNINQIICSFLTVQELKNFEKTSKHGLIMVPQAVRNISSNISKQIASLDELYKSSESNQPLMELIESSEKIQIPRYNFQQIKHQTEFPYTTTEIYKMYLKLIGWKMEDDSQASIISFHSKGSNFNYYSLQYVEVSEEMEFHLELFFDQFTNYYDIQKISLLLAKIYLIMKISYFMKINHKDKASLDFLANYKKSIRALRDQHSAIQGYFQENLN